MVVVPRRCCSGCPGCGAVGSAHGRRPVRVLDAFHVTRLGFAAVDDVRRRNYRLRFILHCGIEWHTPQASSIRGRLPRFIA